MERISSPNQTPQPAAERAMMEENVTDLRSRQQDILHNADMTDAQKQAAIDETVRDYLGDHGVDHDDDNYDTYYSKLRALSADNVSTLEWNYGNWDRQARTTSGKTGFDKLHDMQHELFGRRLDFEVSTDATEDTETEVTPDEQSAELLRTLTSARDAWSTVSAKRQGRAANIGIKDRKKVEEAYHAAANAYIAHELAELIADPNESDEFKQVAVVQHLFIEQEALRDQTREKLKDTKINKFVEFMNKGSLSNRIAKGLGLGITAGFVGTALAGAAGAGLIAGSVIATSRFAKGYAVHSRDKVGTKSFAEVVDADRLHDWRSENTEFDELRVTSDYFNETFEEDTKHEQSKRRKALALGAGSVAAGAAIGYGLHGVAEWASGRDLQAIDVDMPDWHWPHISGLEPSSPNGASGHDLDNDGIINRNDLDIDNDGTYNRFDTSPRGLEVPELDTDGDGVRNWQDVAPNNPEVDKLDWSDFNADAHLVHAGEGWYETFDELGMPEEIRDEVLTDIGPKLKEAGWAYYDNSANEWRISQPGKLPVEVLKIIAKGSERQNFTLAA